MLIRRHISSGHRAAFAQQAATLAAAWHPPGVSLDEENSRDREAERAYAHTFAALHGIDYIASGAFRAVFDLQDRFALKLPWADEAHDGYAASMAEAFIWAEASARDRRWLAPVLASDPEGAWLVMPLAQPVPMAVLARLRKVHWSSRVAARLNVADLEASENWGMLGSRLVVVDYAGPDPVRLASGGVRIGHRAQMDEAAQVVLTNKRF